MEQKPQLCQYVHLPENENIGPLERAYRTREGRLEYNGREVLYLIVETTGVTFCDGSSASRIETVHLKGYITKWKYKTNEKGEAISEIEPIEDKATQQKIREMLQKEHISKLSLKAKGEK